MTGGVGGYSWIFIALAFLVGIAVLFILAVAIKNWVFELSPREWSFTVILAAALGALGTAYLDGDALIELLAGGVIFLAVIWWIIRLAYRRHANRMRRSEE